jgi:transcriptional regulator GlxA family with amidase domain
MFQIKFYLRATLFIIGASLCLSGQVPAAEPQTAPKKVLGVLLFPGFELLDAYGPMEMWGNLRHVPAALWDGADKKVEVELITIGRQAGMIAAAQGPKTHADYGYAEAPPLDFLLVPGGMGVLPLLREQETLNWLRARAKETPLVMSVCNGASLLAAAGLLDGRPATTNKMLWKLATAPGPQVKWVKQARWVDDGDIVTSSGVSAGMDMSLAVIARLYGLKVAARLEQITEYTAHRESSWDPFAVKAGLAQ